MHIEEKRDPARVAPGLTRYLITDQSDPALEAAAALCPSGCIERAPVEAEHDERDGEDAAEALGDWRIDQPRCIHCDVCRELAPGAIRVEGPLPDHALGGLIPNPTLSTICGRSFRIQPQRSQERLKY